MDRTDRTHTSSPALLYARIFGVAFTLAGVLGLILNTEQNSVEPLLGLDVNLTHNIVHLATGIAGLVAGFTAALSARVFALALGVVYTLLAIWGLASGGNIDPFDLFVRINMADHVFHLVVGLLGITAYVLSRDRNRDAV